MKLNKSAFNIIKLSVGIAILIILFLRLSPTKIIHNILLIKPIFIVLVAPFFILALIIASVNLKLLLLPIKKVALTSLFKIYSLCWSIGMVLPGKLGEFSVAYFLEKKEDIPLGQGTAIFVLDNLITLANLTALAIIGAITLVNLVNVVHLLLALLLILSLFLFFCMSSPGRSFLKKHIFRRYASKFKGFYQTLSSYLIKRKRLILINIGVTFLKFLCGVAIIYLLFISFDVNVSLLIIIFISAISRLISLIPISISGLGVREAVSVSLYSIYGISAQIVLPIFIIVLVINYSLAALISFTSKLTIPEIT